MTDADVMATGPALILAGSAVVAGLLSQRPAMPGLRWLGVTACAAAAVTAIALGAGAPGFAGSVARDGTSVFFIVLTTIGAGAAIVLDPGRRHGRRGELTSLLLFSACGAVVTVSAQDLVVLLAGIALLMIPLYPLGRGHAVRGASSLAAVAYGVSLLYAATGETAYGTFGRATHNPLYLSGLALVAGGLLFVLVLAPTERWSVLVTAAAVGALLRVGAATHTGDMSVNWEVTLAVLGALAMGIATVAALTEERLRRLVGYATLLQLGSVATAAAAFSPPAAAFALSVYTASATVLFAAIAALRADEPLLRDLGGLARRRPAIVIGLAVALAAVVGLPPTAGFIGRIYVFEAAIRGQLLWLVIIGALAGAGSFVAYARVLFASFAAQPIDAIAPPRGRVASFVALFASVAIVVVGLIPGPLLDAVSAVRF
ncbi:MAG: hypothetical protein M3Z65_01305 [Chloroflexota bacterium]|nr:hypothetical protein [Chloroflexota bacterium]